MGKTPENVPVESFSGVLKLHVHLHANHSSL